MTDYEHLIAINIKDWATLVFKIEPYLYAQESPSFRMSTHNLLKRYNDIDYDSFVGLMGRRNAGE